MSMFMIRIELMYYPDADDYETLHGNAERVGLLRTIRADNNVLYQLPPAEYYCEGSFTREQVAEKAKWAAQQTGKPYAVVISEVVGVSWVGLDVAQPSKQRKSTFDSSR